VSYLGRPMSKLTISVSPETSSKLFVTAPGPLSSHSDTWMKSRRWPTGLSPSSLLSELPPRRGTLEPTSSLENSASSHLSSLDSSAMTQRRYVIVSTTGLTRQKTLLVYGHYDVQPALKEDGWKHEPFKLTVDPEGTGKLYGRGSTDDKGPVMGWLNVIEAHKNLGLELPVSSPSLQLDQLTCRST